MDRRLPLGVLVSCCYLANPIQGSRAGPLGERVAVSREAPPPPARPAARDTAPEPRHGYFRANGLRFHYVEWGAESATPLLLLHHINSHARTWDHFARSMSRDHRVIALDMRGHGDSDWAGDGKYTAEDYAADVAALVDHLRLPPAIVLGGSTGGRVALVFAAQHPERVTAVIMEDVGAVRPASIAQGWAERLARGDPEFDTVEEWARQLQGQNRRTPFEGFLHDARHGTRPLPNGKLGLKRDPAVQRDLVPLELWHYVERLRAPLLVLIGSESSIVGKDQQDRFRQILPTVELVTIQDAGHIIVHDQPEAFERAVRQFLAQHGL
ncbi:MAG: alpha/beta hydrolase [Gemmatimonadetes bacterium]|nr:alpha/beta hydrolase [Gemmatimonadota bacterium]